MLISRYFSRDDTHHAERAMIRAEAHIAHCRLIRHIEHRTPAPAEIRRNEATLDTLSGRRFALHTPRKFLAPTAFSFPVSLFSPHFFDREPARLATMMLMRAFQNFPFFDAAHCR